VLRLETAEAILAEAAAAAGAGLSREGATVPVAGSAAAAASALGAAAGPPRCPAWAEPLELAPLVEEVHAANPSPSPNPNPNQVRAANPHPHPNQVHAAGGGAAGRRKAQGSRGASRGASRPGSASRGAGRPGSGGASGGVSGPPEAGGLDLKWWDWGTTDAQQKKGWSMSAAQQMLSRIEHIYAHAEAMAARTMRLSSQGRGGARDELRALTEVHGHSGFSQVR